MSKLNVTDLDFQNVKSNLREWMRKNSEFTDYDFEGSGLSYLLDVLAYNTHYNSVLANFMANEMFLDTAIKRSSVISHAKALGYRPRGYRGARAYINLTINSLNLAQGETAPDQFVLRRGTAFVTSIENSYYQFVLNKDYTALKNASNNYVFENLEIVEGLYNTFLYPVTDDDYTTKYEVPNLRPDVSTMIMRVYENTDSVDYETYQNSTTLFDVDENSAVFFTQEIPGEKIEFYFGNGVVGKRPPVGSVIYIEYVSTNGVSGNGARNFVPATALVHDRNRDIAAATYTISLNGGASFGGTDAESVEEIKYNASKHFTVQNRAVTASDYRTIIQQNFGNIESIRVWGGEENIPVRYNSVFVCIKPEFNDFLTEVEKENIRKIVSAKSIMNMSLQFVDPEYLNLSVLSTIYYSPTKVPEDFSLEATVSDRIRTFSDEQLEAFSAQFRYSRFVSMVDNAHPAINNNITKVTMYKSLDVELNVSRLYVVNFLNAIRNQNLSVTSSRFRIPEHDGLVLLRSTGTTINVGYFDDGGRFISLREAGTVNFDDGVVSLTPLRVTSFEGSELNIFAIPFTNDIYSSQNNILRIRPQDIIVRPIADIANQPRVIAGS